MSYNPWEHVKVKAGPFPQVGYYRASEYNTYLFPIWEILHKIMARKMHKCTWSSLRAYKQVCPFYQVSIS